MYINTIPEQKVGKTIYNGTQLVLQEENYNNETTTTNKCSDMRH